tara:strand:- start:10703 stop:11617 length:915 start_codon:yes stop_codon:yes gene_type:complete
LAEALQSNLGSEFETTVWRQDVFGASTYPFPVLIELASSFDFAIFILTNESQMKDARWMPNQNVILELGAFSHAVGHDRVFAVVPEDFKESLVLPTDLNGFTLVPYDSARSDGNHSAAVGPAGRSVRNSLRTLESSRSRSDTVQVDLFPNLQPKFDKLIRTTRTLATSFVHSRRWRGDHGRDIKARLEHRELSLTAFVPDPQNEILMDDFARRFDDGKAIPAMIGDTIEWLSGLIGDGNAVEVLLFPRVLPYSVYRFDDVALVALYPMASERRPSPTFTAKPGTLTWNFIEEDLTALRKDCRSL